MQERTWNDYKSIKGGLTGARDSFEKDCETLYRKIYQENVQIVEVKKGDGGIDVFVGEYYNEIKVIQCKGFFDEIKSAQIQQINNSFRKAINSQDYKMKSWDLCVPRSFNKDEHNLWSNWKQKVIDEFNLDDSFIKLVNGNELIDLMKEHDIYRIIFDIDTLNLLHDNTNVTIQTANKVDSLINKMSVNHNPFSDYHKEEGEQSILFEIFNEAIDRAKLISEIEKEKLLKHDSMLWVHTEKVKIPLNFPSLNDQEEVKSYFKLSLLKQSVIKDIFGSYDSFDQDDVTLSILFDYNKLKSEFSNNLAVLRKLIDIYSLKKTILYKSLSIAFVLTFFEDCTIFEKTKEERINQTKLF